MPKSANPTRRTFLKAVALCTAAISAPSWASAVRRVPGRTIPIPKKRSVGMTSSLEGGPDISGERSASGWDIEQEHASQFPPPSYLFSQFEEPLAGGRGRDVPATGRGRDAPATYRRHLAGKMAYSFPLAEHAPTFGGSHPTCSFLVSVQADSAELPAGFINGGATRPFK